MYVNISMQLNATIAEQDLNKIIFKKVKQITKKQRAERSASQIHHSQQTVVQNSPPSIGKLFFDGSFTNLSDTAATTLPLNSAKSYSDILSDLENLSEPAPDLSYSNTESDRKNHIKYTLKRIKKQKKEAQENNEELAKQRQIQAENRRRRKVIREVQLDTIEDERDE